MKALILAAGLGTRLRPITDTMPKALVSVGGKPMLQRAMENLKGAGFDEVAVNVHHFGQQIIDFLDDNRNFGMTVHISDERGQLLETGGGIKKAARLFTGDEPFLVCNVDILTNAAFDEVYAHHVRSGNDATLLVSQRNTTRYLIFGRENGLMCGWHNKKTGEIRPEGFSFDAGLHLEVAFSGVHVISPSLLRYMDEGERWSGRFSIIDFYIDVCRKARIGAYIQEGLELLDIGKIDTLRRIEGSHA